MSTDSKPTPVQIVLQQAIAQGREMAARPTLAPMVGNIWAMRARSALSRVYGEDAPELDFWCPKPANDSAGMTSQAKIAARLPALERLSAMLNVPHSAPKIFIGHGGSPEWLKLRIFLTQTLGLACDEFNIESTAGLQTSVRIETMLSAARMAFLVMTAEDQHANGSLHARENVVHEIGLFQARLGASRAIVLLERGCSRFSNLDGLTTINFPSRDLMARSEEIRAVLAREHVLPPTAA